MNQSSHQPFRVRLLPAVVAVLGLLVFLKIAGIAVEGGFSLVPITPATAQDAPQSGAESGAGEPVTDLATAEDNSAPQPFLDGTVEKGRRIRLNRPTKEVTPAELALLESLRKRRKELDRRSAGLEMRENLLKAAEKRIDEKLEVLRGIDAKIQDSVKKKKAEENERFADLVSMYETMKPKDAARIFSRLETIVLVNVASRMKPRKLAPVLSRMDSASAERLTMEIARAALPAETGNSELETVTAN